MKTEEFIAFWNEKNVSSAEKRLALGFVAATEQLQSIRTELFACLKPQRSSKGAIVPVFDDEAMPLMSRYEVLEVELTGLRTSIEEFTSIAGGPSLDALLREKHRLKKFFESADNEIRTCTLRAVRKGKSDTDALENKDVQAALAKKDHLQSEFGSKLEAVEEKIKRAGAILAKH
jgi:hypothetical protein